MSDYIDRNVAIDAFCGLADALNSAKAKQPNTLEAIEIRGKISGVYLCKGLIRTTKSADVAPIRHGHWIFDQDEMSLHCSYCDEVFRFEDAEKDECLDFMEYAKYCLACGTRMDGESND